MVEIERLSFFAVTGGGMLRFAEHSPLGSGKEHHECGCTQNTDARPTGKPSRVTQTFRVGDSRAHFRLSADASWLTFGEFGMDDHTYFIFSNGERSVKIETSLPGYGPTDYFFAHLYYGNQIDVSKFINGHSPSNVVDLAKIDGEQLWLHGCSWGDEAVRTLENRREIETWSETFRLVDTIANRARGLLSDVTSPVENLRARLAADDEISGAVDRVVNLIAPFVENPRNTELFRLGDEIFRELHPGIDWNDWKRKVT